MNDYTARIKEIQAAISQTQHECAAQQRLIGSRVVELPAAAQPEGTELLVENAKAISARVDHASSAIERMMQIDERQDVIRRTMKELQGERDQLAKGLEPVYQQLGAVAFRIFREHPVVDAKYSDAFANLARYQDEVRAIDRELEQLNAGRESAAGTVFNRIARRGRNIMLQSKRSGREGRLPRLLQEAGRTLWETDFVAEMDDDELSQVAQPLQTVAERASAITDELQSLKDESGELLDEFNTLSRGQKLQRARQDREAEIATAREELNTVLLELGSAARAAAIPELADEIRALEHGTSRVERLTATLERLQAGLRAQILEQELAENARRSDETRAEIERLKTHLAELEEERGVHLAEQQQALERRGAENELFDA